MIISKERYKELMCSGNKAECELAQFKKENKELSAESKRLMLRNESLSRSLCEPKELLTIEREDAEHLGNEVERLKGRIKELSLDNLQLRNEAIKLKQERKGLFKGAAKLRERVAVYYNNIGSLCKTIEQNDKAYQELMQRFMQLKETNAYMAGRLKETGETPKKTD